MVPPVGRPDGSFFDVRAGEADAAFDSTSAVCPLEKRSLSTSFSNRMSIIKGVIMSVMAETPDCPSDGLLLMLVIEERISLNDETKSAVEESALATDVVAPVDALDEMEEMVFVMAPLF